MHRARALAPLGLRAGHVSFLATLYRHDGMSQDELAGRLHIDKATTCRALRGLEEAGYVRREHDAHDRRVRRAYLTDLARHNRRAFFQVLRDWNDTLLEGFGAQERERIMEVVHRLADNAARRALGDKENALPK